MKDNVRSDMLSAALAYAAQGWPVFPCNPLDKRPLTQHGFKDATTDVAKITAWWARWPGAMIGIPMGSASGVFCVDLDRKPRGEDGVITWEKLESENGTVNTRTHGTPSAGQHKFFQHQDGFRNIPLDKLAPGLEMKADGGYVIVPPSRMADGKEYTIIDDIEPAPAPLWLLEMVRRLYAFDEQLDKDSQAAAASANEPPPDIELIKAALDAIPSDDYDDWYRIAGALRRELGDGGYSIFEAWSRKSKKFNAKECHRKWDDAKDIRQINAGTIFHYADEADETWRDRYEQRQAGSPGSAQGTTSNTSKPKTLADLLKNAATLQTQTFEPLRWTVNKYLLEGLNLLGGKPKIGKSWMALDVAAAVASDNGTCMGEECEHGDVLALMLEDNDRRMQRRLTTMLGAQIEKWPKRLTYATSWSRLDVDGLNLIREWISTAANPRLIIIDILERVLPRISKRKKRSQYSTDYYGLAMLQEFAKKYPGLCFLVNTHQRKADADDYIDTISGTLGVTGAADAILILGKDKVSGNKFLYGRGRDLEEFNVIIRQDEHARWQVLGPTTEQASSPERTQILAVLKRAGKPMTIKEIASDIGGKYVNVKYLIFKLHAEGHIEKVATGLYRLPIPQEEMPF
jgi:Bifunctional DNA primase/polymerase, N-terminal/AAA domain/Primase C terminal 2 (PriCT-2)